MRAVVREATVRLDTTIWPAGWFCVPKTGMVGEVITIFFPVSGGFSGRGFSGSGFEQED
jgi:hypothetical protein